MPAVLQTEKLCKSFGALTVADDIDFRLEAGARHALIGPNGAGKTTFVNMLTGAIAPTSGKILLNGREVTGTSQAARVKLGLGRTFQITTLFRSLPVLDNVALAVATPVLSATLGLAGDAATAAQDLPYGKQRLVEIAIALGLRPKVLLLDEPAAGVPSADTERILQHLEKLSSDIAILIIEHDMDIVFRFAREITVLVQGQVLVRGTPDEIARDQRVRDVYLGEGSHA